MNDTDAPNLLALQRSLEREAQAIIEANAERNCASAQTYLVADFEYRYRRETHAAWRYGRDPEYDERGRVKMPKIRWPFHVIASASWIVLRFEPGADVPTVSGPVVMTLEDHYETDILKAFFAGLEELGHGGQLITWGGEARDLTVLRHQACRHSLTLPFHLRDTSPYARQRIDLCRATSVQADDVHLDEYAAGSGIPAKPSPPSAIGKLVEADEWGLVRDHNLADVMTTSIIALNWLSAMGEIECDSERSAVAIADAALSAFPGSVFLTRDFKPWARDRLRAAGMGGAVYRIDEAA